MANDTTAGIVWRRRGPGYVTSEDGRWVIAREQGMSECENPHAVPLPRSQWFTETVEVVRRGRSRMESVLRRGYYCSGGSEHEYTFWQVDLDGSKFDATDTLREAKRSAESYIGEDLE